MNTTAKKEMPVKRLLPIKEASVYLGRSITGVRELIWAGKLPCIRIDKRIHLDIYDLEKVIEKHKTVYDH